MSENRAIEGEVMDGAVVDVTSVHIAQGARVEPGAYIRGPAYLGHASEMKNSVPLPHAKAPHFAYVGDSILGCRVNLGAGTKLSNATLTGTHTVTIDVDGAIFDTGLRKLGAIVGDDSQIGCNVVTNPGTLLGPRVVVYPGTSVRGYHAADTMLKLKQLVEPTNHVALAGESST